MSFARASLGTPAVLVVAPAGRQERLVERLTGLDGYAVRTAEQPPEDASAIDESVAALVVSQALDDWESVLTREQDTSPHRPAILVTTDVDDELLGTIAAAGATAVPESQLDRLATVVDEQASAYLDHWGTKQRHEAIEQLYETDPDTLFVKDDQGRHLYLSDNPEIPVPESALGETDLTLHDSRFGIGERWYETDMAVLQNGEPVVDQTETYSDGHGNTFYQEVSVVPWRGADGAIRGVAGMRTEVTDEILQQQEVERKNRRLDQFVDYISHDLQNPLQVAHGYLELAKSGDEDAMDAVGTALERMDDLIDDVEQLARGVRKEKRERTTVPLATIVEEIWAQIDSGDAELTVTLPPETLINGEVAELRPMVENLLKNALEHAPSDVSITVGALNDGFYVEDDGPGVPEHRRDEIFEKGYTTAADGAGTGLAIVADVAEAHDWDLDVVDGRDGGARFRVRNCLLVTDPSIDPPVGESLTLTDSTDVGSPQVAGESAVDEASGRWTVTSAGADIYGPDNQFHYVSTTVDGPVRITAHVSDIEPVHGFSKAGLMVRDVLTEDAVHGYVGRTVDWGTELLWCTERATETRSQHLQEDPDTFEWFRIDRVGSTVTCWVSRDGREWQVIDQRSVPFDDPIHVGLVTCSVVPRNRCTGVFENVAVRRLRPDE